LRPFVDKVDDFLLLAERSPPLLTEILAISFKPDICCEIAPET
jgi:hypothetical protein